MEPSNFPHPSPMPPSHVLVHFVVLPSGHGGSVTDFWGWDAHEAQLRCPDVSGDTGGCSARRALKPKFYQPTQTMVTAGIIPFKENSHARAGNRTRDLMISSQRLWPLDREAGPFQLIYVHTLYFSSICYYNKIISLYCNCKDKLSLSLPQFFLVYKSTITVTGRNMS